MLKIASSMKIDTDPHTFTSHITQHILLFLMLNLKIAESEGMLAPGAAISLPTKHGIKEAIFIFSQQAWAIHLKIP